MADLISFTCNYNDHSNESGFQFEFFCDRCGDGYRSTFKASAAGTASTALDIAGDLVGGIFGSLSSTADRVRDAAWGRERDAAFKEAINEVKPLFKRCPRCTHYVCESCWNEEQGLCMDCAPKMASELAATKAKVGVEQMEEQVRASKVFGGDTAARVTVCPNCGKPVGSEKFCGNCGTPLAFKKCPNCGQMNNPAMRFCGECGTKL
jgi:ribosomal protein L32